MADHSDSPALRTPRQPTLDVATLMRVRNLPWRARSVVEGFNSGLHRSPYHGFSAEFSEYRGYSRGDDVRFVDWRLFARSDRYFVKRFEEETNRRCFLLVDQSRSMQFGSLGYNKQEYANTIAATLAQFFLTQRDAVGLVTFSSQLEELIPAARRTGQLHAICVGLSRPAEGSDTDLKRPLEQLAAWVPRRGLVVVISDLLAPIDRWQPCLGQLRARGHEVVVLGIWDPAELSLAFDFATLVVDIETGQRRYVDPQTAAGHYQRQFSEHRAAIAAGCATLGIAYRELTTDQPIEGALTDLIAIEARASKRAERGRAR